MKAAIEKTTRIGRTMSLCLGLAAVVAMAVLLSLTAFADTAEAKKKKAKQVEMIVFSSDQTSGEGVNNPTGDLEIFIMNPDGTELKQLTFNTASDNLPALSPDGKKIAYRSLGIQSSNPQGDQEVYLMNVDGSGQRNLTNTAGDIDDFDPDFSPSGEKIVYRSDGPQASNLEGDFEVYVMNALDGSGQRNLTNNSDISDFNPDFSPDGKKIAYASFGVQFSNPQGDTEVYVMKADGSNRQNLTNTATGIDDKDPDFGKVKNG